MKAHDNLRSTFPIPAAKLRSRKLKLAFNSPVTWAPFLPTVGAFAFFDIGPFIFAGLVALVGGGVFAYWKSNHRKLESKLLEALIAESNQEQDKHLVERARELMRLGYPDYAASLGSFLEKKKQIETAIHSDGDGLTTEKKDIENLIDAVVFGVADQIEQLATFDNRIQNPGAMPLSKDRRKKIETARSEISNRVHEAFAIIEDTWENLSDILNPAAHLDHPDTSHSSLENALSRLKQERDIAKRVKERMTNEWGDRFGEAPIQNEERQSESE